MSENSSGADCSAIKWQKKAEKEKRRCQMKVFTKRGFKQSMKNEMVNEQRVTVEVEFGSEGHRESGAEMLRGARESRS